MLALLKNMLHDFSSNKLSSKYAANYLGRKKGQCCAGNLCTNPSHELLKDHICILCKKRVHVLCVLSSSYDELKYQLCKLNQVDAMMAKNPVEYQPIEEGPPPPPSGTTPVRGDSNLVHPSK